MASKPTLQQLEAAARERDVTPDINRWYRTTVLHSKVLEIQNLSYASAARQWLNAMRPEQMYRKRELYDRYQPWFPREVWNRGEVQQGTATLGQRRYYAERYAELAGVKLEEIARDLGLEHFLTVIPQEAKFPPS